MKKNIFNFFFFYIFSLLSWARSILTLGSLKWRLWVYIFITCILIFLFFLTLEKNFYLFSYFFFSDSKEYIASFFLSMNIFFCYFKDTYKAVCKLIEQKKKKEYQHGNKKYM